MWFYYVLVVSGSTNARSPFSVFIFENAGSMAARHHLPRPNQRDRASHLGQYTELNT
jgi:hypothetical protein